MDTSTGPRRVVVLFSRTPDEGMEMDLEIIAGEVLTVEEDHINGDWWFGRDKQGRCGYFPSNFVKELPMSSSSIDEDDEIEGQRLSQDGMFYAEALYTYHAQTEDDLSFEAGDEIEVRHKEGEWWLGVNLSSEDSSREGYFPSNYVQALTMDSHGKSDMEDSSSSSSSSSSTTSSSCSLPSADNLPFSVDSTSMTKPKYKDTEESEAADKCKNDKNAVTNLDFLFQRKDTESEFVDTVRNDDITADVYDCNNDSIDDYEIAEQLLQKLLEGQKNLYDDSPLGFVHSKISQQEDSVNREIIDMLIQWEETINQNTEADDTNSSSSSSSNDDGDVTCSPSATVPMKMLQKLNLLDLTMEKIEDWLEWRIKEFSDVSEELTSIENERKHLDVTTKNLSILKRDMTHLIEENCLTDEEEKVIQAAPDLIINSLSGSFVDIKSQLKPLTAALEKLHCIRWAHNQQKKLMRTITITK